MFLDQELKDIQEAKNRLAVCCDLRRRLVHIEIQEAWCGARRALSHLTMGLAVAELILGLVRARKANRR